MIYCDCVITSVCDAEKIEWQQVRVLSTHHEPAEFACVFLFSHSKSDSMITVYSNQAANIHKVYIVRTEYPMLEFAEKKFEALSILEVIEIIKQKKI